MNTIKNILAFCPADRKIPDIVWPFIFDPDDHDEVCSRDHFYVLSTPSLCLRINIDPSTSEYGIIQCCVRRTNEPQYLNCDCDMLFNTHLGSVPTSEIKRANEVIRKIYKDTTCFRCQKHV